MQNNLEPAGKTAIPGQLTTRNKTACQSANSTNKPTKRVAFCHNDEVCLAKGSLPNGSRSNSVLYECAGSPFGDKKSTIYPSLEKQVWASKLSRPLSSNMQNPLYGKDDIEQSIERVCESALFTVSRTIFCFLTIK